jgi:thymidylate kinase
MSVKSANTPKSKNPVLITFSGLDGSGKSTQIASVTDYLKSQKMRVVRLAFWDDAVVGKRYREGFVHKVYKSEKGIGAPGKPVHRRDKNMRGWYLSIARAGLYFLDAVHLCEVIGRARRGNPDVIIMDRYIYDELANMPLQNPVARWYVKSVNALVPKPDLALLLDADPIAARERKPEYPVEFMKNARQAYFKLASLLGRITTIAPQPLEKAKQNVLGTVCVALLRRNRWGVQAEAKPELAAA